MVKRKKLKSNQNDSKTNALIYYLLALLPCPPKEGGKTRQDRKKNLFLLPVFLVLGDRCHHHPGPLSQRLQHIHPANSCVGFTLERSSQLALLLHLQCACLNQRPPCPISTHYSNLHTSHSPRTAGLKTHAVTISAQSCAIRLF